MSIVPRLAGLAAALLLAACQTATTAPPSASAGPAAAPQASAPAKPQVMVAAANPLAVEAGLKVLRAGGSAVDAAVAVQAVLGLVEPQSSGLGGGAFMLVYEASSGKVTAYDGRETAPAAATPDLFLDESGKPLPFPRAVLSGRSTGVPGALAMLSLAQREHGVLPWNQLFAEAEALADRGFVISPRLGGMIDGGAFQAKAPDIVAYFSKPDGTKYASGDVLKNPAYAATLRRLAAEGPKALLEGPIAQHIVARTHEGALPGAMTLADLSGYRPKSGEALCRPYRVYVVCVPPLPSGGPALLEGLGILANTDIAAHRNDAEGWYLFAQASRLMYADRDRYMGDPAFVDVPLEGLLDPAYLAARARLIGPTASPAAPAPGTPKGAGVRAPDATREPGGTSHIVIVDAKGDVVSMTTTVESIFGSGRMVDGFILNNQLTDFSFAPANPDGTPAANAVAGGKRPRSSMSPTLVLDRQGRFVAAFGSPGGSSILAYNLKTAVAVMDWGMGLQEAIDLPNLIARGTSYGAEVDKMAPATVAGLAAKGVVLTPGQGEESGLHGVQRLPDGSLRGGADPRREGQARGF